MDEEEILSLVDVDIKYEVQDSDDEYQFQFELTDHEYRDVLKELRAPPESDEDNALKLDCPYDDCSRTFQRQHNLMKHLITHELGLENKRPGSMCHICGKVIKGVYSLHMKIHEDTKHFKCEECGKTFRQKVALNNHILIHRNEKPHQCPFCLKQFRQKYTMQHHIKSRHTGIKDHICDLCGKEFGDKSSLQKHNLVHSTTKPHQCPTCFMSFRHKSSLSRHNKIHLKMTQCNFCNRTFRYETFLKKHLMTAHKCSEVHYMAQVTKEVKTEEEVINVINIEPNSGTHYYQTEPMTVTISSDQTYSS